MKKQNAWRQAKRRAMKAKGKTFTERVYEAMVLGKPVETVVFTEQKKVL